MNEAQTRYAMIDPALKSAGWTTEQIQCEYSYTDGSLQIGGKRGKQRKIDYLLFWDSNIPLAVVEAKATHVRAEEGQSQARIYSEAMNVFFAFSTNGKRVVEYDRIYKKEREFEISEFPSPETLMERLQEAKRWTDEQKEVILTSFFFQLGQKTPRYYQYVSVNKMVEHIATGNKRGLLVMATGVGKTYTAFQIIHRLMNTKGLVNGKRIKKVLFLADRNILVDQTIKNDFSPFGKLKMGKIRNGKIEEAKEIFLGLYQQLAKDAPAGDEKYELDMSAFHQVDKDFFDLIIIDECHRGSSSENSNWRRILNYFESAIQIGLTATPKNDETGSNLEYFGKPVYEYSLKEGIQDGFLAPYKLIRYKLDKDMDGVTYKGVHYTTESFDKKIVLKYRRKRVAELITEYLKETDRMQKTIIFCDDTEHAYEMKREIAELNRDLMEASNDKYVMRITGNDEEGKNHLESFMDDDQPYPTIVTTSKMLTTGVDAKMVKLLVLDASINSKTEFKQIIGRGTRLNETRGKTEFTIMDFKNVSRLFEDPDFDGVPMDVHEVTEGDGTSIVPKSTRDDIVDKEKPLEKEPDDEKKLIIDGVEVTLVQRTIHYLDEDGNMIRKPIDQYLKEKGEEIFGQSGDLLETWMTEEGRASIQQFHSFYESFLRIVFSDAVMEDIKVDSYERLAHVFYGKSILSRVTKTEKLMDSELYEACSDEQKKFFMEVLINYENGSNVLFNSPKTFSAPQVKKADYTPRNIHKKGFESKQQCYKMLRTLEESLHDSTEAF